jgi:hypothetical protein
MNWITRESPEINRIASSWLIKIVVKNSLLVDHFSQLTDPITNEH